MKGLRFIRKNKRPGITGFVLLTVLGFLILPGFSQANDGNLDLGFSGDGKVVTDFSPVRAWAEAVAIQGDGKIVAVGIVESDFTIIRYEADGDLDATFGSGGIVRLSLSPTDYAIATAVALQPDNKIVVAGRAIGSPIPRLDFALVRLNSDGSLDSSFGAGGKVITFLSADDEGISAMKIQPDGKIVVAGFTQSPNLTFALARYNSNGSLDSSFGMGGIVATVFFAPNGVRQSAEGYDVALQPDGKIVVAGLIQSGAYGDFGLARYNSNGTLDSTFGYQGVVTTDFSLCDDRAWSLALQGDGKLVAAGRACNQFGVARYLSSGELDSTFGMGGRVTTHVDPVAIYDEAQDVVMQRDGKILVGGQAFNAAGNYDFALVRFLTDGTLDPSFGLAGKLTTDFNESDVINDLALQADGKIVAAGYSDYTFTSGPKPNFALARYLNVIDPFNLCIQDESSGGILKINTPTGDYQFTNCHGVVLSGAGSLTKRGSTITLQHSALDRRVMARIDGVRATASIQLLSQGLSFTITDRNITNNSCACGGQP